ncbi:hypothetical protein SUNI508_06941 [Seiridium unicorne]|uniref:C2H2-type domain-containing protein n=1 Tax=Seiridium unicorne TaxID=138068 RepID=A0ABR2UZ23_9PEZI
MQLLHDRILERIEAREYPKTTCPSEVARGLSSDELPSLGCTDWRAAMDLVRQETWSMRQRGFSMSPRKMKQSQSTGLRKSEVLSACARKPRRQKRIEWVDFDPFRRVDPPHVAMTLTTADCAQLTKQELINILMLIQPRQYHMPTHRTIENLWNAIPRLCANCGKKYTLGNNPDDVCRYHRGRLHQPQAAVGNSFPPAWPMPAGSSYLEAMGMANRYTKSLRRRIQMLWLGTMTQCDPRISATSFLLALFVSLTDAAEQFP